MAWPEPQPERVSVRAINRNDLARVRAIFQRTTREDRYCRFFQFKDNLADDDLRQFVELGSNVIGVLAMIGAQPVGMAHAWLDGAGVAELGIIVCSDARKRGIGRLLVTHMIGELTERCVAELSAYALGENAAFAALAGSIGMRRTAVDSGVVTYRLKF